jgi:hypothetical protein
VGLRQRLSQLHERRQAAHEAAETERDLTVVISRLEDFSAKVAKNSNPHAVHHSNSRTPGRKPQQPHRGHLPDRITRWPAYGLKIATKTTDSWQHCSGVARMHVAWLSRFRRLARDFERHARTVATFIYLDPHHAQAPHCKLLIMTPNIADGLSDRRRSSRPPPQLPHQRLRSVPTRFARNRQTGNLDYLPNAIQPSPSRKFFTDAI